MSLDRLARRFVNVVYWTLTFQLADRFRAWKAVRRARVTDYAEWVSLFDTLSDEDRDAIRRDMETFGSTPTFSIIMPTYNSDLELLEAAIQSVRDQIYPHWELCIADDASPNRGVVELLTRLAAAEPRIRWRTRDHNGNISRASNTALELATGEFTALMDHDDLIPPHALYMIAREIVRDPGVSILYSDEDQIDREGQRHTPYFKPDWNIDLLLGQNFISHFGVYRTDILREIGGFREGLEGSQDQDLALRAVEAVPARSIRHVPAILYHWRRIEGESFSQRQLDRCKAAANRAVEDFMTARYGKAPTPRATANPYHADWLRVYWPLPLERPSVSIVIPTRDRADLLRTCVRGLLERTDYDNFEIVIADNDSRESATEALFEELAAHSNVRILRIGGAFNYSRINNEAVRQCASEIIVLLNNDIDVIDAGWLSEMVSHAIRSDVGAVGAKLLYADRTIQHAGVVLGVGSYDSEGGIAGHFGVGDDSTHLGYFGQYILTREVSAVTAACLALRRETFEAVGGLNETDLKVAFNDVDLCLRIREAGLRIVWTPFAQLYHYESQSRGTDLSGEKAERFRRECEYMAARWGRRLRNDPFYNPNFDTTRNDFQLARHDRASKPWRHRAVVQA